MFFAEEDLTLHITRGDAGEITVTAVDEKTDGSDAPYIFKAGEVLRLKIYEKKNCSVVVLQKDYPVVKDTETVTLALTETDTKIGETISKPVDYWYEIELNPFTEPQTIVGYDDDGAKVLRLYPEGLDEEYIPPTPEELGTVDKELDMTSERAIQNQAVARAIVQLEATVEKNNETATKGVLVTNEKIATLEEEIVVERARITNLAKLGEGNTTGDAELVDIRVGADGTMYPSAGESVRKQFQNMDSALTNALGKETYIKDITDETNISQGYYSKQDGTVIGMSSTTNLATEKIAVKTGDTFYISGAYGYYACLIAEFDGNENFVNAVLTAESSTSVTDYEYVVPEGVAYIGCSTRNTSYPLCVKKYVTEYPNVANAIEKAKKEIYNKAYFDVVNVCKNGNFEDTTDWEAPNTTTQLSVADNVATASNFGGTNSVVGVKQTIEVPQVAGSVCFVSAKFKVPKETMYIRLQMNTVDGFENLYYVAPKIYDDYITVCGVKRFNATATSNPILFLTTTFPPQYSDYSIQIKEVTVIKDIDSSLTDEQILTLYSAILEQNNGYIDGTVNVIGAEGLLNKLANEHKNENIVTEDKVVTVGVGGDFPTINSALRYLSKFYPAYLSGGISCEVKILDGTIINEQIHLERIDLSHITITTDNANNTVQVDPTGWGGVTHDTRGNRPFFSAEFGARLPAIKCLFSCIVPEGGWTSSNCTVGYFCNRGSTGVICGEATYSGSVSTGLANVGFENFYDNIIANNNSEIVLREAISRNAGRYGVMARHISRVSARSSDITNCADTGAYADRSSMMDVRFADVSGCYNGLQAFNTSNMTAVETIANNIANVVADSREGSVINCDKMTINNAKDIFKVLNGGTIIATGTTPKNVSGNLYNKAKNTIDVNGIIYG